MTFLRPEARVGHVASLVTQRLGPGVLLGRGEMFGEDLLRTSRDRLLLLLHLLRDDADLHMRLLLDVTALDEGPREDEADTAPYARFRVLYRLRSPRLGYRATVEVPLDEGDPVVASATGLFPSADWLERELWEMYGVYPDGHPHLRPLLLYEQLAGHPLRRDYPGDKSQPLVPLRSSLSEPVVIGEGGD
jgi:NADH-quinone oxidoreductase subunit C